MKTEQMIAILDKIKQYEKIVIFRHKRPDGDAVGSTKGLCGVLRATFPEKDVRLINNDYAEYVAFLGEEDGAQNDEFFADALGIVIDTATVDRISNPQYALLTYHFHLPTFESLPLTHQSCQAVHELPP